MAENEKISWTTDAFFSLYSRKTFDLSFSFCTLDFRISDTLNQIKVRSSCGLLAYFSGIFLFARNETSEEYASGQ